MGDSESCSRVRHGSIGVKAGGVTEHHSQIPHSCWSFFMFGGKRGRDSILTRPYKSSRVPGRLCKPLRELAMSPSGPSATTQIRSFMRGQGLLVRVGVAS